MPDREKVISNLQGVYEYLRHFENTAKMGEWVADALALLKEQEAVEPRKKDDGNPQPWTAWWYVCGDCWQEIEYHDRYCRWCGRSVKWNENP